MVLLTGLSERELVEETSPEVFAAICDQLEDDSAGGGGRMPLQERLAAKLARAQRR